LKFSSQIQSAIEILEQILSRHKPIPVAMKEWVGNNRFAGSSDRAIIINIINAVMRNKNSSASVMDDDGPRSLVIGTLFDEFNYDYETIAGLFNDKKYSPKLLNGSEKKSLFDTKDKSSSKEDWIKYNFQEWMQGEYKATFGKNIGNELIALSSMPDLDIRINTHKTKLHKVAKGLERYSPSKTSYSPYCLRFKARGIRYRYPNFENTLLYNKGHIEVQNEGSQISAILSGARPGMQVLDFCAGQGGKSAILSSIMENSGQIFLHDINETRLKNVPNRMKRLGVTNYQIKMDLQSELTANQLFDIVFVDAPCSGSGTWRRKPDLKWKFSKEKLFSNIQDQSDILSLAKNYVKIGGTLIYVTCSVFNSENDLQIQNFLQKISNFRLISYQDNWSEENHGIPPNAKVNNQETLLLSPMTSNTDGFFIAILQRFE
tara:strand:+ start:10315 stop:11610 length:1296 start_codon:yes stop_codon:yes gene_type:complete